MSAPNPNEDLLYELYCRLQAEDGDSISFCVEPESAKSAMFTHPKEGWQFDLATLPTSLWCELKISARTT